MKHIYLPANPSSQSRARLIFYCLIYFWVNGHLVDAVDISPSKPQGGNTHVQPNKTEGAPSLLKSPFKWIFGSPRSEAMQRVKAPPHFKVDLSMEPKNFTPTSDAALKARMTVINQGKEKYFLEFSSAQHYDFTIYDKDKKTIYSSSHDKVYSQQMSSIVLNQNEKLFYEEELFSSANQAVRLLPGEYKLIGQITSKVPISVEISFQVAP